MRNRKVLTAASVLVAVGIAVLAAGCIPSLHPLYTEKELVFDPSIVGVWAEKDADASKDSWEFKKGEGKSYELVVKEEGVAAKFFAHVVKLGEYRFLDTSPAEWTAEGGPEHELLSYHLIPGHLFWKMWTKDGVLYLALLDPEWLEEKIDENALGVEYAEVEDMIVLTAKTKELQEFVLRAVEDPEAFIVDEPFELHRQKAAEQKVVAEGSAMKEGEAEAESEEGSGAED
jgi:hypothetical protein